MDEGTRQQDEGFGSMGKWLAVGSELPCSVIALLLVGQVVGQAWGGQSLAVWGALVGALLGFAFGVYGVYVTIQYFDHLEATARSRPVFMPDMEEILEDVRFDVEDSEKSSQ
ncbi:MAG: hypothetical protein DRO87_04890 [Candidatus Thorarchaeota archaeon]|nr:MAG: hypothetical protein DRP09_09565 [Candidatus Thorarchaeota archaeon]RLI58761.1 MAG: hypothetical protein DRO87_04890 [Candidatus Thorarchaeota archaeon]